MLVFFKPYRNHLIFIILFSIIGISVFYYITKPKETLPIYTPIDVNPKLVDRSIKHIQRNHKIKSFSLINQNGDTITEKNYKDKIYVANFFFTTCASICPVMTSNMTLLQDQIIDIDDVLLISHSVTPEIDSTHILKKYALNYGINDSKWNLVTGDKKQIYDLARKFYMVAELESDKSFDLIHTESFVLVDKKGRLRGYYDGTDRSQIKKILKDIRVLINQ